MGCSEASVWDTPFTRSRNPSVGLVLEPDGEGTALLVVAPWGLDVYPKYLVRFSRVFAVTCGEEAGLDLDLGQDSCPDDVTAYVWDASPHADGYSNTAYGEDLLVSHYVVLGGDNIASVVSGALPIVETISGPIALSVRYAV